ncbi:hypothetical protein, partial [Conchiformibius steedae]|uniref:hypothetical protein n=1 Tax=Conchiformibius steedae TaxID=153493 RepID=UPI0026EEF504
MMNPEQLRHCFQHATDDELAEFIQQHGTLLALLNETWTQFQNERRQRPSEPVREYAADISPEQLSHHAIDEDETLRFFEHFERERLHNDSPYRR